jgi:hypothetical protein
MRRCHPVPVAGVLSKQYAETWYERNEGRSRRGSAQAVDELARGDDLDREFIGVDRE